MRKSINPVLSQKRADAMRPQIEAFAHELIDTFVDDGEVELIHKYCHPLAARTMIATFGLPQTDLEQIKEWGDRMQALLSEDLAPDLVQEYNKSYGEFLHYLIPIIQSRVGSDADDMISVLLRDKGIAEPIAGAPPPEFSIGNTVAGLLTAGYQNTGHAIGAVVFELHQYQGGWREIARDIVALRWAIEQSLRLRMPGKAFYKTTEAAIEIAGVKIPENSMLLLVLASAGHDEQEYGLYANVFAPLTAPQKRSLVFGRGSHKCPGEWVARMDIEIALQVLRERIPSLKLKSGQKLSSVPQLQFLGFESLRAEW